MEYLPLNAIISEALSITPDTDASDWAIARQWAVTALMQLGTSEEEINVCDITAKNFVLMKPKDMRQYIEMALYDANGCYIPHIFRAGKKRIYPDITSYFYQGTEADRPIYLPVDVSEDTQAFYLGTNATSVAYAKVRYFSYPLDADGMPMIREDEKTAIMWYIRLAKSLKKNDNQSEIALNLQEWKIQCDRAKAMKKKISEDKAKTIGRRWLTMLPIFNNSSY